MLVGAVHHIVYDAWSNGIFFRELTTLYRAFSAGEPSPLPEPPIRFVDFAIWQRERMQGETLQRELSYWKSHLGDPPRLPGPTTSAGRLRRLTKARASTCSCPKS